MTLIRFVGLLGLLLLQAAGQTATPSPVSPSISRSSTGSASPSPPLCVVEQIHALPGGDVRSEVVISWAVLQPNLFRAPPSVVAFRAVGDAVWMNASATNNTLALAMSTPVALFDALLTGLLPGMTYEYIAGGLTSGAPRFRVSTQPATPCRAVAADGITCNAYAPLRFGVIADMGVANGVSVPSLTAAAEAGAFDYLIHAGDLAYDLASSLQNPNTGTTMANSKGALGDAYMRLLQPVLARTPGLICAGNHEFQPSADPFLHYRSRFSGLARAANRSGSSSVRYWSSNIGLVHVIALDTEFVAYGGTAQEIDDQQAWLARDLAAIDRRRTPWVIAFGHKTMWMDLQNATAMHGLLQAAGVNLYLTGHQHNYQRTLPIYTREGAAALVDRACVSADRLTYRNCSYMTNLVVGSAGCRELISQGGIGAYATAAQLFEYGWGIITVHNHSHLHWRWTQVANKSDGSPLPSGTVPLTDEMWLVQTATRPLVIVSPLPTPPPALSPPPASASPSNGAAVSSQASATASPAAGASATASPAAVSPASTAAAANATPSVTANRAPSSGSSTSAATPASTSAAASATPSVAASPSGAWAISSVLLLLNASLGLVAPPQSQPQEQLPLLLMDGRRTCSLLLAAARLLQWPIEHTSLSVVMTLMPVARNGIAYLPLAFANATACGLVASSQAAAVTPFLMPSASPSSGTAGPAARRRRLQQSPSGSSSGAGGSFFASSATMDWGAYAGIAVRLPALQTGLSGNGAFSTAAAATVLELSLLTPASQAAPSSANLQVRLQALSAADITLFATDFAVATGSAGSSTGTASASSAFSLIAGSSASAFAPAPSAASPSPQLPPGQGAGISAGAAAGAAVAALACAICIAAVLFVWFRRGSKVGAKAKSKLLRTFSGRSFGPGKGAARGGKGISAGEHSGAAADAGLAMVTRPSVAAWGSSSGSGSSDAGYPTAQAAAAAAEAQMSSHARRASAVARARSSSTVVHFNPLPVAHGSSV